MSPTARTQLLTRKQSEVNRPRMIGSKGMSVKGRNDSRRLPTSLQTICKSTTSLAGSIHQDDLRKLWQSLMSFLPDTSPHALFHSKLSGPEGKREVWDVGMASKYLRLAHYRMRGWRPTCPDEEQKGAFLSHRTTERFAICSAAPVCNRTKKGRQKSLKAVLISTHLTSDRCEASSKFNHAF